MDKDTRNGISGQSLLTSFSWVKDPRVGGRCQHKLLDIIVITVCAVIAGAQHWKQIAMFGRARHDWFKEFLSLPNGIPSHQTFARVFSLIPAESFFDAFTEWSQHYRHCSQDDIIAIDGKTLRQSGLKKAERLPLHLVNAFATRNGLTLACVKTPDKSNEIKGIVQLIKKIEIKQSLITIDAMGCQKGIANLICLKNADYLLALKKNHKRFYNKVSTLFEQARQDNYKAMVFRKHQTVNNQHSRDEHREYTFLPSMYFPLQQQDWPELQTIIEVKSIRNGYQGDEKATRYYISSVPLKKFIHLSQAIREHWHVENCLHWKLDVGFAEDALRFRHPNVAENLAMIRKIALFYLDSEPSSLDGIAIKRWKAALDNAYLAKVVNL